jgi:hypothetical protein
MDPTKHNYYRKLVKLQEQGKLPAGSLTEVDLVVSQRSSCRSTSRASQRCSVARLGGAIGGWWRGGGFMAGKVPCLTAS